MGMGIAKDKNSTQTDNANETLDNQMKMLNLEQSSLQHQSSKHSQFTSRDNIFYSASERKTKSQRDTSGELRLDEQDTLPQVSGASDIAKFFDYEQKIEAYEKQEHQLQKENQQLLTQNSTLVEEKQEIQKLLKLQEKENQKNEKTIQQLQYQIDFLQLECDRLKQSEQKLQQQCEELERVCSVQRLTSQKSDELTQQQSIVHAMEQKSSKNNEWFEHEHENQHEGQQVGENENNNEKNGLKQVGMNEVEQEQRLNLDEGFEPTKKVNMNFKEEDGM